MDNGENVDKNEANHVNVDKNKANHANFDKNEANHATVEEQDEHAAQDDVRLGPTSQNRDASQSQLDNQLKNFQDTDMDIFASQLDKLLENQGNGLTGNIKTFFNGLIKHFKAVIDEKVDYSFELLDEIVELQQRIVEHKETKNAAENDHHLVKDYSFHGVERLGQQVSGLNVSPLPENNQMENRQDADVNVLTLQLHKLLQNPENSSENIKKFFSGLIKQINSLKKENEWLKKEKDEEDGIGQDEERGNTAENFPQEILPSVTKTWKEWHEKHAKPYNCPASCVPSALFCYLIRKARKRLCHLKFSKEIQERQVNWERCSSSPEDLERIGLKNPFFCSSKIDGAAELDEALRIAVHKMREKGIFIALIVMCYKQGIGAGNHCMMIRPYKEKVSNPAVCAEIYDPQCRCLWPKNDPNFENVITFLIYVMEDKIAKAFVEKCDLELCKEERLAVTSSDQVSGIFRGFVHDCELEDTDFYTNKQLKEIEEGEEYEMGCYYDNDKA